jgi:hypothetical protein
MKTPSMVVLLRILGCFIVLAGVVYGISALLNTSYLADPELEEKYPTLFAKYTAAQGYDAMLSALAFGWSILVFGFAALLAKVAEVAHYIRLLSEGSRADAQASPAI